MMKAMEKSMMLRMLVKMQVMQRRIKKITKSSKTKMSYFGKQMLPSRSSVKRKRDYIVRTLDRNRKDRTKKQPIELTKRGN